MRRVVLVPGVPALLPENAGLHDPVADLRAACAAAVAWLTQDWAEGRAEVEVWGSEAQTAIATHLLSGVGAAVAEGPGLPLLVIGNGSAMRTEKAPGHFDERAEGFDAAIGAALRTGDATALAGIDADLAADLWADVDGLRRLGEDGRLDGVAAEVDLDDVPYGVQYWVMRWACES